LICKGRIARVQPKTVVVKTYPVFRDLDAG
jgi:hypothetical protein